MKIILGSRSPGRAKVLRQMGYEFEIFPADIDEKAIRCKNPDKLVKKLAQAKASAIIEQFKKLGRLERYKEERTLLITSDQVVLFNGDVREKPVDVEEARAFIKSYSERSVELITAVVVVDIFSGSRVCDVDRVTILFHKLYWKAIVNHYVENSNALKCAGGIEIENKILKMYSKKIEGDQLDSAIGLPPKITQSLMDVFLRKI